MTTMETFDNIYRYNKWVFGSGSGSVWLFNKPFVKFVNDYLDKHHDIKTIVDIGCGDWQLARHFNLTSRRYIGCDVSKIVIDRVMPHTSEKVSFQQLDAVTIDLPNGDLAIIKDVLHHLSNIDVSNILTKLKNYKYAIMVNDICENSTLNHDISTGGYRPLDIKKWPFKANEFVLTEKYVEGLYAPMNILLKILGKQAIQKGIYVSR